VYFDGIECTAAVVTPLPPPFTELDAGTKPCMPGKFCKRSVAEVNPVFAISSLLIRVTGKEDESSFCAMLDPVTTISTSSGVGAGAVVSASAAITCPPNPIMQAPAMGRTSDLMLINFPIAMVVSLESEPDVAARVQAR
jgi:hypothetical protein